MEIFAANFDHMYSTVRFGTCGRRGQETVKRKHFRTVSAQNRLTQVLTRIAEISGKFQTDLTANSKYYADFSKPFYIKQLLSGAQKARIDMCFDACFFYSLSKARKLFAGFFTFLFLVLFAG